MMGYGEIIYTILFLSAGVIIFMIIGRVVTGVWWKPTF